MFKDIISKCIKEVLSINTTIKVFLGVLILAFIVGFCASCFKKNKVANILEQCSEKIIEKEIGLTIDFTEITDGIDINYLAPLADDIIEDDDSE